MIFLSTFLIAVFITISLIPPLSRLSLKLQLVDMPDERKVHVKPIPRCGGIALALGAFLPVYSWAPRDPMFTAYLAGAGVILLFGLLDDYKGLSYKTKFIGQIAAALILIYCGGVRITKLGSFLPEEYALAGILPVFLTLIAIVGVTNAINLSDGLDGLAGGISLLGFSCIGYLAYLEHDISIAVTAAALSGAIFGFLRFNTHPASLFMGDTGSLLLGFSAAALSLGLTQGNTTLSPFVPLLILGFPILDTLTVMAERISQGRSPFSPDKNHFHHRLMRLGMVHSESVFLIYVIQSLMVVSAFLLRFYSEWTILVSYLIFSGCILAGFHIADRLNWTFKRYDLIDRIIKGRLRVWKEKGVFIKFCFKIILICIPLLLLAESCALRNIPVYLSAISLFLGLMLLSIMLFKRNWLREALALSIYSFIPFVIYLNETRPANRLTEHLFNPLNLPYFLLAVFVILTLRFTRRQSGFKTTPTDFLVILLALVMPVFLSNNHNLSAFSAKMLMLFFSYEVLIGELRGKLNWLIATTLAAMGLVAVRGMIEII